jgi:hypothetical protein
MYEEDTLKNIEKSLSAILMVLIESRENSVKQDENGTLLKSEILLQNAGHSSKEIAVIMSKKVGAVIKTLQRSRKK